MTKTIVLVDYENFHVTATKDYNLRINQNGLKHLVESWKRHGKIASEDILVAAYWDYFRAGKEFFRKIFSNIIDVPVLGSNVTDGYLIVEAMQNYQKNEDIENVILVAGDGVNRGLVEYFLKKGSKVFIYFWEKGLSRNLRVNEDVTIYLLDDVFGFSSEEHIKENWFEGVKPSTQEYAIICRVLNSRFNDLYFNKTVREIVLNSEDERYQIIDTLEKGKEFLNSCKDTGIFTATKKLGSKGKDEITVFELNRSNEKVLWVIEQEKARKKAVGKSQLTNS